MKKCVALMLALALCLTPVAAADEGVTAVEYSNLSELVVAGNPDYLAAVREVRRQELALEDMEEQHAQLLGNWQMASAAIMNLQESMKSARETLARRREALADTARAQTVAAQKLYVNHHVLLAEVASAARALAAAEGDLHLCREKAGWGYVAQSVVAQGERTVRSRASALEEARLRVEENCRALAKAVGLQMPIAPGGLPDMDVAQIPLRDEAAERAAYVAGASAVRGAEEALEGAEEAYQKTKNKANEYVRELAQLALDTARLDAAAAFDALYADLLDAYEDYLGNDEVPAAQRAWENTEARYAMGLVSGRALAAAADTLADAQVRELSRRVGLWGRYLDYLYRVTLESGAPS